MQTSLDQLLEEISFRRRKELRSKGKCDKSAESGCSVQSTTYWTDLFVRHFLFQTEYEVDRDDLLFFIRKTSVNNLCYKSRNLVDVSIELCRISIHQGLLVYMFHLVLVICNIYSQTLKKVKINTRNYSITAVFPYHHFCYDEKY